MIALILVKARSVIEKTEDEKERDRHAHKVDHDQLLRLPSRCLSFGCDGAEKRLAIGNHGRSVVSPSVEDELDARREEGRRVW